MVKQESVVMIFKSNSVKYHRIESENLDTSSFCSVKKSCENFGEETTKKEFLSGKLFSGTLRVKPHSVSGERKAFGYIKQVLK